MDEVLYTVEAGVARVTLNRPDQLNAMNGALMDRLVDVLRDAALDSAVACVILTGAGRGFCAGGDLRWKQGEHEAASQEAALKTGAGVLILGQSEPVLLARMEAARWLHNMPKPTIAMINGPCAGAGLSLAGACDLRFAGRSAVFTTAFAKAGLSGDYGGSFFWSKILGSAKARELYFLAERLDADTAFAWGMLNRLWPDEELLERTLEIARHLASGPHWALGYAKRNINAAETASLDAVFQSEATHMGLASRTSRDAGFTPAAVLKKPE